MTDPLLRTKVCMPPVRSELVRRDRLLERLGAGLPCTERRTVWRGDGFQRKLTLVSAPAGYGKTTLVTEWLSDLRLQIVDCGLQAGEPHIRNLQSEIHNRTAWLSLDEADNDPTRFLAYLIAALSGLPSRPSRREGGARKLVLCCWLPEDYEKK
jgi:LuxR family maltose regulon positive regulatory protein